MTLPKLRRMICAGTEILNANAQLLSILMAKNIAELVSHICSGTAVGLRRGSRDLEEEEAAAEDVLVDDLPFVTRAPEV